MIILVWAIFFCCTYIYLLQKLDRILNLLVWQHYFKLTRFGSATSIGKLWLDICPNVSYQKGYIYTGSKACCCCRTASLLSANRLRCPSEEGGQADKASKNYQGNSLHNICHTHGDSLGSIGPSPSKSSEEVQIFAVYINFGRQVTESRSFEG